MIFTVGGCFLLQKSFVDQVVKSYMHPVCRLRDDADLKYLYLGPKKPSFSW